MQARATADVARNIFLIATEESGDRLGANLMKVLRQRLGDAVRFEGVGGQSMAREGLVSLFPIEELSIMGLRRVVKQLPKILRLIRQTADAVIASLARRSRDHRQSGFHPSGSPARARPRSLDSDRRLRLAVGLGMAARPGACDASLCRSCACPAAVRAGSVSQAAWTALQLCRPSPDRADRDAAARIAEEQKRRDECATGSAGAAGKPPQRDQAPHGGVWRDARPAAGARAAFEPILPDHAAFAGGGREALKSWPVQPRVVVGEQEKRAAFRIAHAALAKSGTVTLELALAACRWSPPIGLARRGVDPAPRDQRTSSVILANLVIGENVVPEFCPAGLHAGKAVAGAARHSRAIHRYGDGSSKLLHGSTPSCRPATSRRVYAPPTSCWRRCGNPAAGRIDQARKR